MKRVFCLLLVISLSLALSACKKDVYTNADGSEPLSSEPTLSSKEETVSSEVPSESSSTPTSSAVTPTPSRPTEPTLPPAATGSQVLNGRTILDPDNTRGLSTERNGYGYGIASGGQPHSISVNNQNFFDSLSGVEALTLDRKSGEKCMYLTFDCGYEYQGITGQMLDILKEKNVKAAFFCTLDYFKKNYSLVRRMIDEGHIVGNHSATHPDFSTISRTKMAEEIYIVEDYLKNNYNYSSPYFRFPSGAHSVSALDLVSSLGYKSIFWSVAHKDWETANQPTADEAYNTVTSRYHSGAVILLHSVSTANRDALARMIDKAHQDGYIFKTLDQYYQ